MPFHPDQPELEAFIGTVLDAYKDGRAGRTTVLQLLSRALTAAANDNESEFMAYVRLSQEQLQDGH